MIISSNKAYRKTYLCVSEDPAGFRIQTGDLPDPKNFVPENTILISGENPNLLWDLLHDLSGIPYPKLQPVALSVAEKLKTQIIDVEGCPMMEELKKLSAKEIVEKVKREKGIEITISLKSKSAIMKKALKIYRDTEIKSV